MTDRDVAALSECVCVSPDVIGLNQQERSFA